jgi:hypothetical protein
LSESEKEASEVVFECSGCEGREKVHNDELESSGFAVNKVVMRFCKRCESATAWKWVLGDDASASVAESQALAGEVTVLKDI